MNRKFIWAALSLSFLAIVTPLAADDGADQLKKTLVKTFPDLANAVVKPAPIKGLYVLEFDGQLFYATADGKHMVMGDIIDVATRTNLTEEERGRQAARLFSDFGESNMIVMGPADAKRTITVFTDVDCGYCARLHLDAPELNRNGVKVRYLLYPRNGLDSETYKKSVAVWCAQDRVKAIGVAKAGGNVEMKTCTNPVEKSYRLGERLGVSGTPTIYLDNGRKIGGYVPAPKMLALLGLAPGSGVQGR